MDKPKTKYRIPIIAALVDTFGLSPLWAIGIALFLVGLCVVATVWVIRSAPPRIIFITTGPIGSSFERFADAYQKLLAPHGVTLVLQPSEGSLENLRRLEAGVDRVDLGFVQGGLPKDAKIDGLESLGSVAYQPLWVFYRNATPISRLAELAGKRIAVGAEGSGAHALAVTLLAANRINAETAVLSDLDSEAAATDLIAGKLDAVFLMGDSAPQQTLRNLVRVPGIQLFSFTQADAYVRRFPYLSKLQLPDGAIDLSKNLPAQDVALVGPTVELVARKGLNPALCDLLLEVAKEVHGKAGLMQRRGEFPAPLEQEISLSADALSYYKSGKGFFYRTVRSFWLASLLNRILVAIVPLLLVVFPAMRFFPVVYRWSIQLRIYRCYRPLLRLERNASATLTKEQVQDLLRQLDEIEESVNHLKMPVSFAYQFYALRGHLAFVRERLKAAIPA